MRGVITMRTATRACFMSGIFPVRLKIVVRIGRMMRMGIVMFHWRVRGSSHARGYRHAHRHLHRHRAEKQAGKKHQCANRPRHALNLPRKLWNKHDVQVSSRAMT
ncbi:hypothetical protein QD336_04595 [Rhizobium sp. BR 250]